MIPLPSQPVYNTALGLIYRRIDLSTARAAEVLSVPDAGSDGFYCDHRTDGDASLHLQESNAYPFPVRAQSGMRVEFNRLFITNTAQAGKTLHLWFGRGFHFLQPTSLINTIDSITLLRGITPPSLGSSWFSYGTGSALQTIVAPASNTAGVKVYGAAAWSNINNTHARLMHKASAPTGVHDTAAGTISYWTGHTALPPRTHTQGMVFPLIVPAGRGVYYQSNSVEGNEGGWLEYEVL